MLGEDVDFLSLLPEATRRLLLEHSNQVDYPAGTIAFRPEDPPATFLIARGLVRVYRSVPDGRQATVSFIHTSELVGGTKIVGKPSSVFVQIVVDSRLTLLDLETVRSLAAREIDLVAAIARHLAAQLGDAFQLICVRSLGGIRERLAYDLLERACRRQLGAGRLDLRATHADLADSIGSSREVVSRTLKSFRASGMVETAPGIVRVVDPIRLADIVRAFAL